eukprot:m.352245 g.352245  ORF g.352245 m.352245 type:complete len:119 (-) comp16474_c0_seq1:760-1116(-)
MFNPHIDTHNLFIINLFSYTFDRPAFFSPCKDSNQIFAINCCLSTNKPKPATNPSNFQLVASATTQTESVDSPTIAATTIHLFNQQHTAKQFLPQLRSLPSSRHSITWMCNKTNHTLP